MIFEKPFPVRSASRVAIQSVYLQDESKAIAYMLQELEQDEATQARVVEQATALIQQVRDQLSDQAGLDAFMREYSLSSQEGVVLMSLAEALLRIPDSDTADRLIQDKLAKADWQAHLGHSGSWLVNTATWGLMLTGRLVDVPSTVTKNVGNFLNRLVVRSGEPVIRAAIKEAMRIMGYHFVMGRSIQEALKRTQSKEQKSYLHSFDMLGEAALTREDTEHYFTAYLDAITELHAAYPNATDIREVPGISVKLSALHPCFTWWQRERVMRELPVRLLTLCETARDAGIGLTIDAEEADRLELTLDLFAWLLQRPSLQGWDGLGLAVQAYQKRAPLVIDWLAEQCQQQGRKIMLRLVKGAYWDTEIKRAQEAGLEDYPVYSRKVSTDVSYLFCVQRIIAAGDCFYPQFATHNAYTVAAVCQLMPSDLPFEFQRLHGMGVGLYQALKESRPDTICRVYSPVGGHKELLPYLVRRLLENGANTSFINRIEDQQTPLESLVQNPVVQLGEMVDKPHSQIPCPTELFAPERRNAMGINLHDELTLRSLEKSLFELHQQVFSAAPLINGESQKGETIAVNNPANNSEIVGEVVEATAEMVGAAFAAAQQGFTEWRDSPIEMRAACLERAADLFESHHAELISLCIREAGRGVADALSELREAVDFCRYYAAQLRKTFQPISLPGPTGEENSLLLHGRGVFVCISPWNFPLAIFTGQVAAALAAGNAVIAKPARQTPLIAMRVVQLMHEAGIPTSVLQLLPGASGLLSQPLLSHPVLSGVAFTGSTQAALKINRTMAARDGAILPLIAETGGQNVMIVDSSALPEQVVQDVLFSAFNSAGQRCSALRVLFLQEESAERIIELMKGAIVELKMGDPAQLSSDVGPIIDEAAQQKLQDYVARMKLEATLIAEAALPAELARGSYVAPVIFEIDSLSQLGGEVFGPVLHVIRFGSKELDKIMAEINGTGYGLTLGIHSRIESTIHYIQGKARIGNVYVNRNMIGAVVGVQPFGGENLSGTGPKAGGPYTLLRYATEQTLSNNVAALGGNAALLGMTEE